MVVTMALMCFGLGPRSPAADEQTPAADQSTFKMEEISIFDQKQGDDGNIARMSNLAVTGLGATPAKEVKAYPQFNSKKPLYGTLVLNKDPEKPGEAVERCFVLDQSPEAIEAEAKQDAVKADEKTPDKNADAGRNAKVGAGVAAKKYDLLYFDVNNDLDLTNDAVVHLMKEPPKAAAPWMMGNDGNASVFDVISVSLDDNQSVRMMPIVRANVGSGIACFVATSARQGEIRLGKRVYKATLSCLGGSVPRFDRPQSPLILTPVDGPKRLKSSSWMNMLGTIREADGEFYTISASPAGDQLFVRPCDGDRGVLEVSAGKRDIKEMGLTGLLQCKGSMFVLGDTSFPIPVERARVAVYRLPVGDYQPVTLNVDYGCLQVSLRANRNKAPGAIEIRKDKPFVLDFSEKAELQFLWPPKDKVFEQGNTVALSAMLAIPEKNLQVCGLSDTRNKVGETKWKDADGKEQIAPRYASLVPEVVITDASGKKVGGGKMPFG